MEFLKLIKETQLLNFRSLPLDKSAEEVKTRLAVSKTEYNLAYLLYELPTAIKEFAEQQRSQQAERENKVTGMRAVQERGEL